VPTTKTGPSGIDYLGVVAEQYRQRIARQLRLADPANAAALTPWAALTVVTAGRLLTAPAGG
jgi:hypothetical protein